MLYQSSNTSVLNMTTNATNPPVPIGLARGLQLFNSAALKARVIQDQLHVTHMDNTLLEMSSEIIDKALEAGYTRDNLDQLKFWAAQIHDTEKQIWLDSFGPCQR